MEWYYAKAGNPERRGVVDGDALRKMARRGELQPDDLVYSAETGEQWMPASTVAGLFPARPARRRSRRLLLAAVPVLAAAAGLVAVWMRPYRVAPRSPAPPPPLPAPPAPAAREEPAGADADGDAVALIQSVERAIREGNADLAGERLVALARHPDHAETAAVLSNRVAVLRCSRRIETALGAGELVTAERLIRELSGAAGAADLVTAFSNRLDDIRAERLRLDSLHGRLKAGTMRLEEGTELVALHRGRGTEPDLENLLTSLLDTSDGASPDRALSVSRVASVMQRTNLVLRALEQFCGAVTLEAEADLFMEAAGRFVSLGRRERAAELLERYAEGKDPERGDIWYELAALKALGGDERAALRALRNAVRRVGDPVRRQAREDERFAAIRDGWSFRRLVGED